MYDLDLGSVAIFNNVRIAKAVEELTSCDRPEMYLLRIQTMRVLPIWAASFRDFSRRAQPSTLVGRRIALEAITHFATSSVRKS